MESSALLLHRLNPYCTQALREATSLCRSWGHREILPEHWLLELIELSESDITLLSRNFEWEMGALGQDLRAYLCRLPKDGKEGPELSGRIITLLKKASLIADRDVKEKIRSVHLLMAMTENRELLHNYSIWLPVKLLTKQIDSKLN